MPFRWVLLLLAVVAPAPALHSARRLLEAGGATTGNGELVSAGFGLLVGVGGVLVVQQMSVLKVAAAKKAAFETKA